MSGRRSIFAIQGAATWGTAVAVGANDGAMPKDLPTPAVDGEIVEDQTIANFGELQYMDVVRESKQGTIPFTLRRTGDCWPLLAALFGNDTTTGSGPYTHTLNWQYSTSKFNTIAWEISDTDICEMPSVKPIGATFKPDGNGFVDCEIEFLADTVNAETDDSLTNNAAAFNAVTYISKELKIPSEELRLRINAQGGAALGSGDDIAAVDYTLSIRRPLEGDRVTAGVNTGAEKRISEPIQDGHSDIQLSFEVPDYSDITKFNDFKDETLYKAELYWARTVSSVAYSLTIQLGSLQPLPPGGNLPGQGRHPLIRNFRALEPQSTPTGFSTDDIINLVLVDNHSSVYA
jgi:hypothetical protein